MSGFYWRILKRELIQMEVARTAESVFFFFFNLYLKKLGLPWQLSGKTHASPAGGIGSISGRGIEMLHTTVWATVTNFPFPQHFLISTISNIQEN